jgi:hypothetical protein
MIRYWRCAEETEACFIVRDANGQALAYVYFEDETRNSGSLAMLAAMRRASSRVRRCSRAPGAALSDPAGCGARFPSQQTPQS